MTDQEDNFFLGKIVFDHSNQERNFWACLGQTCSRSLIAFFKNVQLGSKEERFWRPKKIYSSLKLLLLPSLTICFDMEGFVLVPASVYNKSLISQSVKK